MAHGLSPGDSRYMETQGAVRKFNLLIEKKNKMRNLHLHKENNMLHIIVLKSRFYMKNLSYRGNSND